MGTRSKSTTRLKEQSKRFLQQVKKREDGCWEWLGNVMQVGYGRVGVEFGGGYAHRAAYRLFKGPLKDGLYVCHTCDRKTCVNPDHLYLGTPRDNMRDWSERGHGNRGMANGNARIPPEIVAFIQAQPVARREHARSLGIGWTTYNRIHKKKRRANG